MRPPTLSSDPFLSPAPFGLRADPTGKTYFLSDRPLESPHNGARTESEADFHSLPLLRLALLPSGVYWLAYNCLQQVIRQVWITSHFGVLSKRPAPRMKGFSS